MMVIGLHGAGLSNVIFCSEGTPLVELALPEPTMRFFAHAAMALSLPYWAVYVAPDSFRKSIVVDIPQVVQTTRLAWRGSQP